MGVFICYMYIYMYESTDPPSTCGTPLRYLWLLVLPALPVLSLCVYVFLFYVFVYTYICVYKYIYIYIYICVYM